MSRKDEYWKIFITETREEFDKTCLNLVEFEKNPSDQKLVDEVFRLLHNMKANTKAMGLEDIGELFHVLENIFSQIRTNKLQFDHQAAEAVFYSTDYIELLLGKIEKQESYEVDSELIENLNKIAGGEIYPNSYFSQKSKHGTDVVNITDQVNISIKDLDDLLNMVGELVIDRDQLMNIASRVEYDSIMNLTSHLSRVTDQIRDKVMDVRLINVGALFNRLPKIIRDIASAENKEVEVEITGTETKIDRNVLSAITDSIIHIVRNAVAHGIENPEKRKEKKKSKRGKIQINASSEKGVVEISIKDDGGGIDYQKVTDKAYELKLINEAVKNDISKRAALELIFLPALSTSDKVTENSGRGVGLDVVKTDLEKLGGYVDVDSKLGSYTEFILSMPISIAVKSCLVFKVQRSNFAIPLQNISSVLKVPSTDLYQIGDSIYIDYLQKSMPLIYLSDFLYSKTSLTTKSNLNRKLLDIIIISYGGFMTGLIVDELLRQQELVVKPIKKPLDNLEYYGGITVLATGDICFILDVANITKTYNLELTA